ncbi:MAG: type II toxin-antitoxin system RelE/ParE family toxin [Planctomycetota bacterium]
MREVVIRPRAFDDLESIWLYTYEQWSDSQAAHYLGRLNERITELAETAEQGKRCDVIREGYHSIHVCRHLIFYTLNDEMVGIGRVLHDQMDLSRHL